MCALGKALAVVFVVLPTFCVIYTCTLPRMRTSRRVRGQPPEGQARREVESADSWEALPGNVCGCRALCKALHTVEYD